MSGGEWKIHYITKQNECQVVNEGSAVSLSKTECQAVNERAAVSLSKTECTQTQHKTHLIVQLHTLNDPVTVQVAGDVIVGKFFWEGLRHTTHQLSFNVAVQVLWVWPEKTSTGQPQL